MERIWAGKPQILGLIPAVDLQAERAAVHGILARTRSRTETSKTLHLLFWQLGFWRKIQSRFSLIKKTWRCGRTDVGHYSTLSVHEEDEIFDVMVDEGGSGPRVINQTEVVRILSSSTPLIFSESCAFARPFTCADTHRTHTHNTLTTHTQTDFETLRKVCSRYYTNIRHKYAALMVELMKSIPVTEAFDWGTRSKTLKVNS